MTPRTPPIPDTRKVRLRLQVRGVVQGVGFRPYVYNLARRHGLDGFVLNSPRGVFIEVEGAPATVEAFLTALPAEAPPLVRIAQIQRSEIPALGEPGFSIRESAGGESAFALVPPDICVCDACLADTRDPSNRRHDYPFTNCTNCGPRYSIILDVPYDRPMTTMAEFAMCPDCRRECESPEDRRFHAQPNACPVCGPRLQLASKANVALPTSTRAILETVADRLRAGSIVAWKGLGGYQLACDARQPAAVEEMRRRKRRSEKPFAIMVADADAAATVCFVSHAERVALVSPERPIVLLRRHPDADLADGVSPGNPNTGVMLPCTPMHDLLFRILRERWPPEPALVMTSGNISEEPIVIENAEAEEHLAGIADLFAHHNRRIHTRVDDSVVRVVAEHTLLLRRARGYTPRPVWLGRGEAEVLACGAQLKNTLCLTRAGFALPSQHLGDLENYETLRFFTETLERMRRLFHVTPTAIAYDLHPGYLSTQFALQQATLRPIGVQHHHAHIASCMAEHQLEGRVIGVAWDGTGFGTDGTIWGGEFLAAGYTGFDRYARLRPILLAGGDAGIREPWRVARSYLRDAFEGAIPSHPRWSAMAAPDRVRSVDTMLQRRVHAIPTSSAGRLFDAVASLIGLRHTVSFEGQAAMMLEAVADSDAGLPSSPYAFALTGADPIDVDLRPMIREIVAELERGTSASQIASRFHATLVAVVTALCRRMRDDLRLHRVCLSGGCFQNALLLEGCLRSLADAGFEVFFQQEVPANDGGISLGQAAVACEILRQAP
ncbi:MAG TPA: carbamoyltransferase HypF [Acidobacteriaceae bacterium]|jgi:hydrogenase maturation protein HypF|nr:carbamoyltransferase HypF [Acidobacteriaceae bacterium]